VKFERFRQLCLSLPEAEERETWGEPTFRVRDRIFAMGSLEDDYVSLKASLDDQSGLGETRWPVERTLAWVHQNRRLRIRYERRPDIHQALLTLACIKICASALFAGFC